MKKHAEEQRERLTTLYWDKLDEVTHDQFALVARVVSQAEIDRTPEAKAGQKLVDKSCWLEKKVREYRDVAREAKAKEAKAHFGRIFEICSQKGSELPKGHPEQKWKGRSVFQGNKVSDENNDHAIFAELGSSPASMEAAKIIDVYGSQPNFSKQQADARQAYTQALFQGVETWVRLPRSRWPKEWEGFEDPVCPLMIRIQEGSGRTIVPLSWRAMVGFKFFLKYGRAFSTTQILSFSWSLMLMTLRWPGLRET